MRGRIRTIKPEIAKNEELWDLGQETGLPVYQAFTMLWCYADREGRFEWRPRTLKTDVLPYWDGDFSRVLDALVTRGFVTRYTVDGREYGLIPTFIRHQVINNRETNSGIPSPIEPQSISASDDALVTRDRRVEHATSAPLIPAQVEGKGREGKGRELERDARVEHAHIRQQPETFNLPFDEEPSRTQRDLPAPQAEWRPRNRQEALNAPIQQRAEWAVREQWAASEYAVQDWPEVQAVAKAFHAAYKLASPKLMRLDQDKATKRIVEALTQYTVAQLVKVVEALPSSKWSLDLVGSGKRPQLSWLSPEVIRTQFSDLPSERPISDRVRKMTAHLEPMREVGT